jgi:RNA polymerase sigma factor (sigma-70 family)
VDVEIDMTRGRVVPMPDDEAEFSAFVAATEPRLRRALSAAYGPQRGREATAEALAYGWEHWGALKGRRNPAGYLYRVGQSRTRSRQARVVFDRPSSPEIVIEPGLAAAVEALPERQRVAVMLVFAAQWTPVEAAQMLGLSASTVRRHAERGLSALRRRIGTDAAVRSERAGGERS